MPKRRRRKGRLAASSPAAQSPANAASGAMPCGTVANSGISNRAQRPSPTSHQAAAAEAGALTQAGAGSRFDFTGSLTIFHPSPENAGLEPRPPRFDWRRRPYRDNNNLNRIEPI